MQHCLISGEGRTNVIETVSGEGNANQKDHTFTRPKQPCIHSVPCCPYRGQVDRESEERMVFLHTLHAAAEFHNAQRMAALLAGACRERLQPLLSAQTCAANVDSHCPSHRRLQVSKHRAWTRCTSAWAMRVLYVIPQLACSALSYLHY